MISRGARPSGRRVTWSPRSSRNRFTRAGQYLGANPLHPTSMATTAATSSSTWFPKIGANGVHAIAIQDSHGRTSLSQGLVAAGQFSREGQHDTHPSLGTSRSGRSAMHRHPVDLRASPYRRLVSAYRNTHSNIRSEWISVDRALGRYGIDRYPMSGIRTE